MRASTRLHDFEPGLLRRRGFAKVGLAAALAPVLVGCASGRPGADWPTADAATRQAIAPTGALRIAVYPGSPTSLVRTPQGQVAGVAHDLGRQIAAALGLPAQIVERQRVQQVVDTLRAGEADFTFSNASPARAELVDFTAPLISVELGYLVPPQSRIRAPGDVDVAGVRVGVSEGSSSLAALSRTFRAARLVTVASLGAAREQLRNGQLDAFATNKAILNELRDGLPGFEILPGRWGLEHMAIAIPQGRPAALAWMEAAGSRLRDDGRLDAIAQRAGLRGIAARNAG